MKPHEIDAAEAVGWHVIARGGDMSARVHPGMCLGEGPPGELSFEPADAIVTLHLDKDGLSLEVVSDDHELFLPPRRRLRAFHVKPKTQVEFAFLGHGLYIDNDLAIANPPEDTIRIAALRLGETLENWPVAMGPLSAGQHPTARERASLPVDFLQREHALASADKHRAPAGTAANQGRRLRSPAAGAILVVLAIASVAVLTQTQLTIDNGNLPAQAALDDAADTVSQPAPPGSGGELVNPEVLARFSALLDADPLPDRAVIDFAVESLKSLRAAYPQDPQVLAALERLTERIVSEARRRYEGGEPFSAGRLMEQASSIGVAEELIDATLADFAAGSAGSPPDGESVGEPAVAPMLDPARLPGQELVQAPVREPAETLTPDTSGGAVSEPLPGPEPQAEQAPDQGLPSDDPAIQLAGSAAADSDAVERVTAALPGEEGTLDASAAEAAADPSEPDAAAEVPEEDAALMATAESPAEVESVELAGGVVAGASGAVSVAADDAPGPAGALVLEEAPLGGTDSVARAEEAGGPGLEVLDGPVDQIAVPGAADEPTTLEELLATAELDDPELAEVDVPDQMESSTTPDGGLEDVPAVQGGFVFGSGTVVPGSEDPPPGPASEGGVFQDAPLDGEPSSSGAETADGQPEPMLASLPREPEQTAPDLLPGTDGFEALPPVPDAAAPEEGGITGAAGREGEQFYPFSALTPRYMVPLEYPARVPPGVDATLQLEFTVSESGRVEQLEVRGDADRFFIREAERAVRQWRFEPVVEEGKVVPVRTALRVSFRG